MGELLPLRRADDGTLPRVDQGSPAAAGRVEVAAPQPLEPLWREAVGEVLREQRHHGKRTLAEVARRAGISVQYLSEVERGRKEPSSEILGAVTGALHLTLVDLTRLVLRRLTVVEATSRRTSSERPRGPVALAA